VLVNLRGKLLRTLLNTVFVLLLALLVAHPATTNFLFYLFPSRINSPLSALQLLLIAGAGFRIVLITVTQGAAYRSVLGIMLVELAVSFLADVRFGDSLTLTFKMPNQCVIGIGHAAEKGEES